MRQAIQAFLEQKQRSPQTQSSYRYDLLQFLDICQDQITPAKLALYQAFVQDLKVSAQRRKYSAVNQFLFFLYEEGWLKRFYKLQLEPASLFSETKSRQVLEDTSILWQETPYRIGQLIALLIVELGLLPVELASLKQADMDFNFQVLKVVSAKGTRICNIPTRLLPFLERVSPGIYLFDHGRKAYSRQWFYNRLTEFTASIGKREWTAQYLRDQYVLGQLEKGESLDTIARQLGLTSAMGLEKYRKWI